MWATYTYTLLTFYRGGAWGLLCPHTRTHWQTEQGVQRAAKLFLSALETCDASIRGPAKPIWISSWNFINILFVGSCLAWIGPLRRNLWEGDEKGEGYLRSLKAILRQSRGLNGVHWAKNLLVRLFRKRALKRLQFDVPAVYHSSEDNSDSDSDSPDDAEEEPNEESKSAEHVRWRQFYRYESVDGARLEWNSNYAMSLVILPNSQMGLVLRNSRGSTTSLQWAPVTRKPGARARNVAHATYFEFTVGEKEDMPRGGQENQEKWIFALALPLSAVLGMLPQALHYIICSDWTELGANKKFEVPTGIPPAGALAMPNENVSTHGVIEVGTFAFLDLGVTPGVGMWVNYHLKYALVHIDEVTGAGNGKAVGADPEDKLGVTYLFTSAQSYAGKWKNWMINGNKSTDNGLARACVVLHDVKLTSRKKLTAASLRSIKKV